jgi:hypothetical protein
MLEAGVNSAAGFRQSEAQKLAIMRRTVEEMKGPAWPHTPQQ